MDLLTKYSDTIIKEIMQTIARSQRKLDKARTREMKLHQERFSFVEQKYSGVYE